MDTKMNPDMLAAAHGTVPIGAAQRTIAFASVADGGSGLIQITAAGHGLKKDQCFAIVGGDYDGIHRVKRVISANVIEVEFTFTATAAGNLLLTAYKDAYGFYCDSTPLTIAEIVAENDNVDTAAFILTPFIAGVWYPMPFKEIRITAGNISVVPKPKKANLSYTNR